jgi:hypothetical protein
LKIYDKLGEKIKSKFGAKACGKGNSFHVVFFHHSVNSFSFHKDKTPHKNVFKGNYEVIEEITGREREKTYFFNNVPNPPNLIMEIHL